MSGRGKGRIRVWQKDHFQVLKVKYQVSTRKERWRTHSLLLLVQFHDKIPLTRRFFKKKDFKWIQNVVLFTLKIQSIGAFHFPLFCAIQTEERERCSWKQFQWKEWRTCTCPLFFSFVKFFTPKICPFYGNWIQKRTDQFLFQFTISVVHLFFLKYGENNFQTKSW